MGKVTFLDKHDEEAGHTLTCDCGAQATFAPAEDDEDRLEYTRRQAESGWVQRRVSRPPTDEEWAEILEASARNASLSRRQLTLKNRDTTTRTDLVVQCPDCAP